MSKKQSANLLDKSGYEFDSALSNIQSRVYHNPKDNKFLVTFRGTKNRLNDIPTDLAILTGNLKNTQRYKDSTLLKVVIHTGRTHQIRVHMQAIGHPIIGDKLYGGKLEHKDNNAIQRQFLHASQLKFEYLGEKYEFKSELPAELMAYKSSKID